MPDSRYFEIRRGHALFGLKFCFVKRVQNLAHAKIIHSLICVISEAELFFRSGQPHRAERVREKRREASIFVIFNTAAPFRLFPEFEPLDRREFWVVAS